jgi:uncharacterized protein YndB with AHSA1/START domain
MTTRDDARLGRLLPDGGVQFVRHLRHAPEKVWRALTEGEHLVHWFPTDLVVVGGERVPGARLELPFWPRQVERWQIEQPVTHGELVAWEEPTLLEWIWEGDRLRWELEPHDGGTRLVLSTWFGEPGEEYLTRSGAGYHLCLAMLEELLDTGEVGYLEDTRIAAMEEEYRAVATGSA